MEGEVVVAVVVVVTAVAVVVIIIIYIIYLCTVDATSRVVPTASGSSAVPWPTVVHTASVWRPCCMPRDCHPPTRRMIASAMPRAGKIIEYRR